jgi:hypothetical protein
MSIFSTILDKLGLKKEPEATSKPKPVETPPAAAYRPPPTSSMPKPSTPPPAASTAKPAQAAPKPAGPIVTPPAYVTAAPPKPAEPARPAAISLVDVAAKLDAMAAKLPNKPNWKVSIADLLFLLGMDHSLKARKELAEELGCPADLMGGDSSQMNIWLHKTVLSKIAENGGNIPKELLD